MSNYNDLDDDLWDVDKELKKLESNIPPKNTEPVGESSTNYFMILIVSFSVLTGVIIGEMLYKNTSNINNPFLSPENKIQIEFTNNSYEKNLLQKIRDSKTSVIWITSVPQNLKIIRAMEHAKEDGAIAFVLSENKNISKILQNTLKLLE